MAMFSMRRKKAIKLLEAQKKEIDNMLLSSCEQWKIRTDAIVKQYIGHTDFHQQKIGQQDFTVLPRFSAPDATKKNHLKMQKILGKRYIDNCLKYLNDGGDMIVKPNILFKWSNEWIWTVFGGSIIAAFNIGIWWVDAPINPKNYKNAVPIDTSSTKMLPVEPFKPHPHEPSDEKSEKN